MSSKVLDKKEILPLQPTYGLSQLYHPELAPHRFQSKTIPEAEDWQQQTRELLRRALGFTHLPEVPLKAEQIEEVQRDGYIRQKWLLTTWEHAVLPFYLLIPAHIKPPYRPVVAFHGHGYGVKDIVGLWEDGEERFTPDGYHKDFGVALCKRGFVVTAPEISCFGERRTDFTSVPGFEDWQTCAYTSRFASFLGGTPLGLRVVDAMKLVDFLSERSDIDINHLGAMGISGGGMHTFFSTALDSRIKAAVISGYYCNFRASILAMNHCECNYVPGLGQFGEIYDLIGLIAPRPVLIESGDHDDIFPRPAVEEAVAIARERVYSVWNASDRVHTDYFEGRHQISGVTAYDFLWNVL